MMGILVYNCIHDIYFFMKFQKLTLKMNEAISNEEIVMGSGDQNSNGVTHHWRPKY